MCSNGAVSAWYDFIATSGMRDRSSFAVYEHEVREVTALLLQVPELEQEKAYQLVNSLMLSAEHFGFMHGFDIARDPKAHFEKADYMIMAENHFEGAINVFTSLRDTAYIQKIEKLFKFNGSYAKAKKMFDDPDHLLFDLKFQAEMFGFCVAVMLLNDLKIKLC